MNRATYEQIGARLSKVFVFCDSLGLGGTRTKGRFGTYEKLLNPMISWVGASDAAQPQKTALWITSTR